MLPLERSGPCGWCGNPATRVFITGERGRFCPDCIETVLSCSPLWGEETRGRGLPETLIEFCFTWAWNVYSILFYLNVKCVFNFVLPERGMCIECFTWAWNFFITTWVTTCANCVTSTSYVIPLHKKGRIPGSSCPKQMAERPPQLELGIAMSSLIISTLQCQQHNQLSHRGQRTDIEGIRKDC